MIEERSTVWDTKKIRPRRDWVLLLCDPRREKTAGGIILPGDQTGIERVREGTGEIVAIGPGDMAPAMDLCVGQKVVFRGFIKYAHAFDSDEFWPDGQMKHYTFMSVNDLEGIVPKGMDVGVFSGRPMVPAKERT